MQPDLLENEQFEQPRLSRKNLLPTWIKIFAGLFLFIGFSSPILLFTAMQGGDLRLAMYGIEATAIQSPLAILLMAIFFLKGLVAYGLLWRKDWAVLLGIIDAVIGLILCVLVMVLALMLKTGFVFRLEIFVLTPYLIKLVQIKKAWDLGVQ